MYMYAKYLCVLHVLSDLWLENEGQWVKWLYIDKVFNIHNPDLFTLFTLAVLNRLEIAFIY